MNRALTVACVSALTVFAAGCSSSGDASPTKASDSGGADAIADAVTEAAPDTAVLIPQAVLVVGTLSSSDITEAQKQHDAVAKNGEAPSKGAGDIGHVAMLGTSLLGTTKNEFIALDRWSDGKNIDGFYSNPDFLKAFGALFSGKPSRVVYTPQPTWHGWGTPDSANDADPHYWVIVRGKLKDTDTAKNKAAHDAVASGGESKGRELGDQAHVVFTGRDDAREFLAIDVWKDATNIEGFYGNPDFLKAAGSLFEGPPSVGVYQSTHWYQW